VHRRPHATGTSTVPDKNRQHEQARPVSGNALSSWVSRRTEGWRDGITVAALDPFRGYATALRTTLPQATRVLDAFHVVRLGLDAVDQVRRRVQHETLGHRGHAGDPLFRIRRLLRRGHDHHSPRSWARLLAGLAVGDLDEQVGRAWIAAQELRLLYRERSRDQAEQRLLRWFTTIAEHEIPELVRLARTLDAWRHELPAYFDTGGVSNGPTEAINGLIKKVKRVGRWSQPAVATPVLVIDWKGVCVPGPRLTAQERNRIEAMWISGLTFPEIAAALGRDRTRCGGRSAATIHTRTGSSMLVG
jgi:hypothetical protein